MKTVKDNIIWIVLFVFGAVVLASNLATHGTLTVTVVGGLLLLASIIGFCINFFKKKSNTEENK